MINHPIPKQLNLLLGYLVPSLALFWLWLAAHSGGWLFALAVLAFGFTNNTVFSLLHEAVHRNFHPSTGINEFFGRFFAAFFPTGLTMQRVFHLSHHQRNRTESEQFDYIRPGDNKWLKRAQWYCILTGFYWPFLPLGAAVFALWPGFFFLPIFSSPHGRQTGAADMFSGLKKHAPGKIRLENLLSFAFQFAVFFVLDLSLLSWAACYVCFALMWSSLQYADHAFSPLDVKNGAWNLRIHPWIRWIYLNYHFHRTHHQRPELSWFYLPRYTEKSNSDPSFLGVYLAMWRGPRPLPVNTPASSVQTTRHTDG